MNVWLQNINYGVDPNLFDFKDLETKAFDLAGRGINISELMAPEAGEDGLVSVLCPEDQIGSEDMNDFVDGLEAVEGVTWVELGEAVDQDYET